MGEIELISKTIYPHLTTSRVAEESFGSCLTFINGGNEEVLNLNLVSKELAPLI